MAASAAWSSCRNPVAPEPPKPSYFISPDTLRANVFEDCALAMSSSDSSLRAYKYVWDFGDGQSASIKTRNSAHHTYFQNGSYRVTVSASDSRGHVIAEASTVAIVGIPQARVSIAPHMDTINSLSATFFQAHIATSLPVTYTWDLGDGSPLLTGCRDTISHDYSEDGVYRVIATAQYQGYAIGSDTTFVTVSLPTTTCAALCNMFSVTSSFSQNGKEWFEFALPLKNEGDYRFSLNGRAFLQSYNHYSHTVSNGTTIDNVKKQSIEGTLSPDGRYLLRTASNHFDSGYASSATTLSGGVLRICYLADSLRLVSASLDSVVFSSYCRDNSNWIASESQWSYDRQCGVYGPDLSLRHYIPSAVGQVRIVFRRNH